MSTGFTDPNEHKSLSEEGAGNLKISCPFEHPGGEGGGLEAAPPR